MSNEEVEIVESATVNTKEVAVVDVVETQSQRKNKSKQKAEDSAVVEEKTLESAVNSGVYDEGSSVTVNASLVITRISESVKSPSLIDGTFNFDAHFEIGDKIAHVSQSQIETARRVTNRGIAIQPAERFLIPTGLVLDIPDGYALEVYADLSSSYLRGLSLSAGTNLITNASTNQVCLSITNNSGNPQYISKGDTLARARLVQLVQTSITVK